MSDNCSFSLGFNNQSKSSFNKYSNSQAAAIEGTDSKRMKRMKLGLSKRVPIDKHVVPMMIINDNICHRKNIEEEEEQVSRSHGFDFNNSIFLVTLSTTRMVGLCTVPIIIAIQLHCSYSITNHKLIFYQAEEGARAE